MKSKIIVGLQWGDEGKGKITDVLAADFDYVVRFNGGNNAGHTIVLAGKKYPLSLIPSGVIQKKKLLIAQGVVINPAVLLKEIKFLQQAGYPVKLGLDYRCNLVMPYHQALDAANEAWKGKQATGSLHLGIGYCYEDRNNRSGMRLEDLLEPERFKRKLERLYPLKKAILEKAYHYQFKTPLKQIITEYLRYGSMLKPYLVDVASLVSQNLRIASFLFEGAHGTMLDPVFGTYPYTVAPPTIAGSMFASVGIAPFNLPVLGISKAYTTRVGNGPFPTEDHSLAGQQLRTEGHEFGTVSGRPRRCGWLDLLQLKYACRLNGVTELVITKLDVLSKFDKIYFCVAYKYKTKILKEYPGQIRILEKCQPVYRELPGWRKDISQIKKFSALPENCQKYLLLLESSLGVKLKYVSTGSERHQLIKI